MGGKTAAGVICKRKVPAEMKGKLHTTLVKPAMLYGLKTVELTRKRDGA